VNCTTKLAGVVVAGGFLAPLSVVLLSEQLSLQGLTTMVRDITATLMLPDRITVLTTTVMVAVHTITVVVPTITVVQVTITTDPTDIGPSTNRVKKDPGTFVPGSLVSAELFNVRF
jgi:hypothetical protein